MSENSANWQNIVKELTHWRLSKLYGTAIVANHSPHIHDVHVDQMISALTVHVAASCGFGMEATVADTAELTGLAGMGSLKPEKNLKCSVCQATAKNQQMRLRRVEKV